MKTGKIELEEIDARTERQRRGAQGAMAQGFLRALSGSDRQQDP